MQDAPGATVKRHRQRRRRTGESWREAVSSVRFQSKVCARGVVAILLASCALVVAACSAGVPSGEMDVLVEKDIDTWALPSDAYDPPNLSLEHYAVGLRSQPCWQYEGLPYTVLRFDPNGSLPAASNAAGRRLFDEEIAGEYGYHEQLDPRINWGDRRKSHSEDALFAGDEEAFNSYVECQRQAMRDLGADPDAGYQYGFPDVEISSDDQAAVEEAATRWRECVAPLGISDLPADAGPSGLPTDSQMSRWGLDQDVAPWDIPAATQEEIDVAVADATCRDSSGWRQAAYDAQWNAQIVYLQKHYKELEAQRAKWEALEQTYLDTIRELGQSGSSGGADGGSWAALPSSARGCVASERRTR